MCLHVGYDHESSPVNHVLISFVFVYKVSRFLNIKWGSNSVTVLTGAEDSAPHVMKSISSLFDLVTIILLCGVRKL
jgi:hypothetical protein